MVGMPFPLIEQEASLACRERIGRRGQSALFPMTRQHRHSLRQSVSASGWAQDIIRLIGF